MGVHSFLQVAAIFKVERHRRILGVPGDVELAAVAPHHHIDAAFVALGNDSQLGVLLDIFTFQCAETAVRHIEFIIEAAEDRILRVAYVVLEYA